MEQSEAIARYALRIGFGDLAVEARHKLKVHLLDALGCALGALGSGAAGAMRKDSVGSVGPCTLIGGGSTTLERAAYYNGTLTGVLAYGDLYFSETEACSPAELIGPVLAAAELGNVSGRELLAALAVAYHVRCRVPGSLSLAIAAGSGRAMRLTRTELTHALRFGPAPGMVAVHQTRLAQMGYAVSRTGIEAQMAWHEEDGTGVMACSLRGVRGSAHAQAPLDAVMQLQEAGSFAGELVQSVRVDLYRARDLAGREVAAEVAQAVGCNPAIVLLESSRALGRMYPQSLPCRVKVTLHDGRVLEREVTSYPGFYSRPLTWDTVTAKFELLVGGRVPTERMLQIESAVAGLEYIRVRDLTSLLTLG